MKNVWKIFQEDSTTFSELLFSLIFLLKMKRENILQSLSILCRTILISELKRKRSCVNMIHKLCKSLNLFLLLLFLVRRFLLRTIQRKQTKKEIILFPSLLLLKVCFLCRLLLYENFLR